MPDINITVAHKVAVSDTQSILCDNSDYPVHWTLDDEWSAYDTKTMRTIYMDGTYTDTVFSGVVVALPVCTVPGAVQIGLFAGDIRTSRVAILRALPSVRSGAGAPADPTESVYDQLMDLIKGLGGVDPEAIKTAVAEYLTEHPIEETDPTKYLPLTGGKLTGNLEGKYITGTWLQSTDAGHQESEAAKVAVLDAKGWIYYRTPAELMADMGIADGTEVSY